MKKIFFYESPVGWLRLTAEEDALTELFFVEKKEGRNTSSPILEQAIKELDEYFSGKRKVFTVPLRTTGSPFQQRVWKELLNIPFATTTSYMKVAMQLGDLKSIRAVGTANGRNPIAIIIPCHRVIGSDGKLVGYGGGLWRKKWLLEFESGSHQVGMF